MVQVKLRRQKLLYDRLVRMGKNVIKVEYPDYESEACAPVKMLS